MSQLISIKDPYLYFSLVFFNVTARYIWKRTPVSRLVPLSLEQYIPDNCTALHNTVCQVLHDFTDSMDKNIMYIITDGYDSHSNISKHEMNQTILKFKHTDRWKFILCDTEINRLNIHEIQSIQYDVNCVDELISQLSSLNI